MKQRSMKFVVEYYFNEHKHWAEVYDTWIIASDTMLTIMKKYDLYKVEIVVLKS